MYGTEGISVVTSIKGCGTWSVVSEKEGPAPDPFPRPHYYIFLSLGSKLNCCPQGVGGGLQCIQGSESPPVPLPHGQTPGPDRTLVSVRGEVWKLSTLY